MPLKPRTRRAWGILAGLIVFGGGLWGVFQAFKSHLVFYYTPHELVQQPHQNKKIRLGGLMERQSFLRSGETCFFRVTDSFESINVTYTGTLPRLFQEGQGVVVEGVFNPLEKLFRATVVLVKHDEVYAPSSGKDSCTDADTPRNPRATR